MPGGGTQINYKAVNMTYADKLKDPRWQKKRLEILERDKWTCQSCFDNENTLMVHHYYYEKGLEPWEYDDNALVAWCVDCHELEHENLKAIEKSMILQLKEFTYTSYDLQKLLEIGINIFRYGSLPLEVDLDIINWAMYNIEYREKIKEDYFEYLKEKNKKRPA
jgi:hypothetical protein